MITRVTRGPAALMAVVLALGSLFAAPPGAKAAETAGTPAAAAASYVGYDPATKGAWNGKYGEDGYILFGYKAVPDASNTTEVNKYELDAARLPSYVEPIGGNGYKLNDGSRVKVEPGDRNSAPDILDAPAGSGIATKVEASVKIGDDAPGGGGRRSFTFHLTDDQEHLFTFYTSKSLIYKYFSFVDSEGRDLFPSKQGRELFTGEDGSAATYVSFKVRGSFTFNYDNEWEDGLQGMFFDSYAPYGLAAQGQSDGSIALNWNNRAGDDDIAVERSADGASFERIAVLPAGSASYVDSDPVLAVGQTYAYRLGYESDAVNPTYSASASALVQTALQSDEPRVILGTDSSTSGQWHDKYGGDGYILVGYDNSVVPKPSEWSTIQAATSNDRALLPDYVDSYAYEPEAQVVLPPLSDSDRYYNYVIDMPADNPAGLPDTVTAGEPRNKYIAYAKLNKPVGTYTFNLNDDSTHMFSLYSKQREAVNIQLQDLNGSIIAEQPVPIETFQPNGGYASFMVKGSFKLSISTPSQDFGAAAFFFDTPLPDQAAGLTAEMQPKRKALIAWTNQGSPDRVMLERQTGNGKFVKLAVLNGNETSYTDENLASKQRYSYRVRNIKGTGYGEATEAVSVTVPAMTPTALALQSTADIAVVAGESVSVAAKFESIANNGDRTALAGKPVSFKLKGEHVGDGITLGQEIPALVGTGVTDENGMAGLTFDAQYTGDYSLVAAADPDDEASLDGTESAPAALSVTAADTAAAPVILKVSDAVKAGQLLSINGSGFDPDTLDIAIERNTDGQSAAEPSSSAIHPAIVQKDRNGYFVVAEMPDNAPAGVYDVWVKNALGWSAAYKMNAARPLFMSDYEAFAGIDITVSGRNFDGAEFGGTTLTKVRLNDGEGAVSAATVKELSPYGLTFTVGDTEPGTYDVEVSNDNGVNWSRMDNGQQLTVVPAGSDPLGLGVAWAKDFDWSNQVDVSDYGADSTDEQDDTAAVQEAVDAAGAAQGGGVVYFPNGDYYIDTINLPSGVVLLGQDEYATKLYYTGTSKNFIDSIDAADPAFQGVPERQGVAKLSLLLSDPNKRPDSFMWLGEGWGDSVSDQSIRTANRLFVTNVNIDYPTDFDREAGSGRGLGLEFIAKERVLVKDNHFVGWHAQPFITYTSQYYTLTNNYFEYTEGFVVGVSTYAFYVKNHVKVVHPEQKKETHGLFARSNAYIVGNTIENTGDISNNFNDGEAIALEVPAGLFNYGRVLKGDADSITVAPIKALVNPKLEYGALSVLITDGTGIGQLRKVTSIDGYTMQVGEPFAIAPDSSSKFTLIAPNDNATIVDNTITNNAKGIWLFGNSYDGLVANNTSIDSEGIFIWSNRNSTEGIAPDYYTRVVGNDVSGISRRSQHGGIGFNTGRSDTSHYYSIDVYATEFRDNTVSGDSSAVPARGKTEAPPYGGIYAITATYSTQYDGEGSGDSTNTLIENNKLSHLATGVDLTHAAYGQIVKGNRYDGTVLQFLNDTGSENTLLDDNLLENETTTPSYPSVPGAPAPEAENGVIQVGAVLGADGTAIATPSAMQLTDAIKTAKDGKVHIKVTGADQVTSVTVKIPGAAVDEALEQHIARFEIQAGAASVTISAETLGAAEGDVSLTIATVDSEALPADVKETVGGHRVYDFTLLAGGQRVTEFGKGAITIALDYELSPGENPDHVVVYYVGDDGKLGIVKNGSYDKATGKVTFSPAHFSRYAAALHAVTFNDLKNVDWAEASIGALAARGIVEGTGGGRFDPGAPLTRAEFLTMLLNAYDLADGGTGMETPAAFSDVDAEAWYAKAVEAARQLGIVQGRPDGTFGANEPVSRQDMAVMLYKTAAAIGLKWGSEGSGAAPFTDAAAIADYASEAIDTIRIAGLIEGVGGGKFDPRGTATRAQAAVIVWRLFQASETGN